MSPSRTQRILQFIRLSRPQFLLGGFLLYGLGVSIGVYLGRQVDLTAYLLGQGIVSGVQLMTHYLNEYYDVSSDLLNQNRTLFSGGSGELEGETGLPRRVAMYAGIAALTMAATLVSVLLPTGQIPLLAWLLLILGFLGAFFYSAPPLRLVSSGYGELVASLVVSGLVPSFAFALQTGEFHRLLVMTTTPLIAANLAMLIVFQLPDYAADFKANKPTLTIRLGWQRAMRLHDVALAFAFASLIGGYFFGMPARVAVGPMIALPLAAAQVWFMWRIRRGFPPRWNLLTASAVGVYSLMAYFELAGYLLS